MGIFHNNIRITGGVMYSFQAGSPPPPPPGGSLLFNGTSDAFYSASSSDFNLGTGDFTIEWFQKMNSDVMFPRIFAVGDYPSTDIGVSIEGNTFYFWGNSGIITSFTATSYINTWTHFAIVRNSGLVTLYENGVSKTSTTYTSAIGSSSHIMGIGSEVDTGTLTSISDTHYDGKLTNLRWSKGLARYTGNFSVPTSPFTVDGNTQMLYLATTAPTYIDDATDNHTLVDVSGSSVTWSSDSPFA